MKSYYNQTSDRLKFVAIEEDHARDWVAFFEGNDRLHLMGIDAGRPNLELAKEWIDVQLVRYKEKAFGHLIALNKDTDEVIGMGGIIPRTIKGLTEYEIAYSIVPAYWGKGYATEIATQMKKFATLNHIHHRMISQIHPENTASINVALKNGMKKLFDDVYRGIPVEVYGVDI